MVMQSLDTGASSKVLKIFLGTLLFGALAGLVMADVGGFFRDGMPAGNEIAQVGDASLSTTDFARTYQRRIDQSNLNPDIALQMGLPNMVLQQEVERLILLQAARQNGVRINDTFIATQLKKQLDSIQMTGTPQEKLQQVLMQQQLSEMQLVELLREDFSINVLASAITTGDMAVPAELVTAAYRHDMQKRDAEIIRIASSSIKKDTLSAQDIQNYFNEHKENYRTVETRDAEILILPQALFIKDANVSDQEVEAFYNENKQQFMAPELVRMTQIIADNKDTAKRIYDEKPADLSTYQTDAVQYVTADWYEQNNLPDKISNAIFRNRKIGLLAPVETSLGWHVILIERFKEPSPHPFAAVKSQIARQIKDNLLDQHLTAMTDEIDILANEDTPLQEIAAKYNLQTVALKNVTPQNIIRALQGTKIAADNHPRIQDAVFTLEHGETSPLMDTASGDYALAKITRVTASAIPEFDTIRKQVEQDAARNNLSQQMRALAEKLIGTFDHTDGSAFDKEVKASGLSVEKIRSATRGNVEDELSADIANLLFTLTPDNALSYAQAADQIILVRLTGIQPSRTTPSEAENSALQENMREVMLQEIQQQFTHAWQNKLGVKVNQRMLQSMFAQTE